MTSGYTYASGSNRLASISGPSPLSFTHDAAGSITAMGDRTFSWDAEKHLRQVTEDIVPIATYAYNAFGQRVGKTAGGPFVFDKTGYHYDREGNLIAESDGDGRLTMRYVYLDGRRLAALSPATSEPLAHTILMLRALSGVPGEDLTGVVDHTAIGRIDLADAVYQHLESKLPDRLRPPSLTR